MKYSYETKLKAVKYYERSNTSIRSAADRCGVPARELSKWLARYQYQAVDGLKKQSNRVYSAAFKLKVIKHQEQHKLSLSQTALYFKIPSCSTLYKWRQIYLKQGSSGLKSSPNLERPIVIKLSKHKSTQVNKNIEQMSINDLVERLRYLEAENDYLKKLQALVAKNPSAPNTKRKSSTN